ncbi:hypothetical protein SRM_00438 [Salinibacter ruber M8]|uniref:Uncharacterized protein n=1 Tax=Salinibacter ruber (strain M8) TaxID=761659 RepID=D5H5Q4_SALRM|nr:hypothetical protein SRM_00438 [Salinibacter ruber M8]
MHERSTVDGLHKTMGTGRLRAGSSPFRFVAVRKAALHRKPSAPHRPGPTAKSIAEAGETVAVRLPRSPFVDLAILRSVSSPTLL